MFSPITAAVESHVLLFYCIHIYHTSAYVYKTRPRGAMRYLALRCGTVSGENATLIRHTDNTEKTSRYMVICSALFWPSFILGAFSGNRHSRYSIVSK